MGMKRQRLAVHYLLSTCSLMSLSRLPKNQSPHSLWRKASPRSRLKIVTLTDPCKYVAVWRSIDFLIVNNFSSRISMHWPHTWVSSLREMPSFVSPVTSTFSSSLQRWILSTFVTTWDLCSRRCETEMEIRLKNGPNLISGQRWEIFSVFHVYF